MIPTPTPSAERLCGWVTRDQNRLQDLSSDLPTAGRGQPSGPPRLGTGTEPDGFCNKLGKAFKEVGLPQFINEISIRSCNSFGKDLDSLLDTYAGGDSIQSAMILLPLLREEENHADRTGGACLAGKKVLACRQWNGNIPLFSRAQGETSLEGWGRMTESTRRHPRYQIETEVLYRVAAPAGAKGAQKAKGVCARNLSQGGLLLEAEEHLPPGTKLASLWIRAKRETIEVQGQVVWAEGPSAAGRFRHGIRITPMEPSQEFVWASFIDEESRELGRRSIRMEIDLPITCRRKDSGESLGGRAVAVNVSRGGFLVLLPIGVPLGTILSLEVRTRTQSLRTDTRVIRVEDPKADGLIPHGLAFIDSQEGPRLLPEFFLLGLL